MDSNGNNAAQEQQANRRGGWRKGSGRPPLPPEERRRRLSVGFTPENVKWLRDYAKQNGRPAARILNDLVAQERIRVETEADHTGIDALVDQMVQ